MSSWVSRGAAAKAAGEMIYGKAAQAVDVDGKMENVGTTTVKFEGVLDEWSQ